MFGSIGYSRRVRIYCLVLEQHRVAPSSYCCPWRCRRGKIQLSSSGRLIVCSTGRYRHWRCAHRHPAGCCWVPALEKEALAKGAETSAAAMLSDKSDPNREELHHRGGSWESTYIQPHVSAMWLHGGSEGGYDSKLSSVMDPRELHHQMDLGCDADGELHSKKRNTKNKNYNAIIS